MKKLFALLLAVILLLSMVACAEVKETETDEEETTTEEKKESKTEEKKPTVVGEWEFRANFGDLAKFNLETLYGTEVSQYVEYDKMLIRVTVATLTADGKFEMGTASDAVMKEDSLAYGRIAAEGVEAYYLAKENKTLQEAEGMTKEAFAKDVADKLGLTAADERVTGTWVLKDGKVTMTADIEGEEPLVLTYDAEKNEMSYNAGGAIVIANKK